MISTPAPPPVDLDKLDAFLLSDRAPEDSMGLSDLDGFLTGIVVGPELIVPSEWMPVVWGGKEPAFESTKEARPIIGTIMGRYNEIVRALSAAPDDFDPFSGKALTVRRSSLTGPPVSSTPCSFALRHGSR